MENNRFRTLTIMLLIIGSLALVECRDSNSNPVAVSEPPLTDTTPDTPPANTPVYPQVPKVDYYHSKYSLLDNVYNKPELRVTFYCECKFSADKEIIPDGCRFPVDGNIMLWEHVVPAYVFGRDLPEWKNWRDYCPRTSRTRGRKCARKHSVLFNKMEGDMYNLYPSVDYLNNKRGHLSFTELDSPAGVNKLCGYDISNHTVEPRVGIRGEIARTYLYMDSQYPQVNIIKSTEERELYRTWSENDPVDAWECKRGCMIEKLQGNENTFLKSECIVENLYSCE